MSRSNKGPVKEPLKVPRPHAINFPNRKRAAKQSFKDQCDVNHVIAVFQKTGRLINQRNAPPRYGDFTAVPDFKTAMLQRIQVNNFYESLPLEVKAKYRSVDEFYKFASDGKNLEELVKLGLVKKKTPPPEKVQKVEVVNSPQGGEVKPPEGSGAKPPK